MKKIKVLLMIGIIAFIYPISACFSYSTNTTLIPALSSNETVKIRGNVGGANYNDEYVGEQFALFTVGADIAHARNINGTNKTDGKPIVVAILDTGVDYTHPDLNGNCNITGCWDYINGDAFPMDDNGHGTHCAGIVAAEMNNSIGIVGIAPKAQIKPYKVLDAEGSGDFGLLIAAINGIVGNYSAADPYAIDIISMSLGGDITDAPTIAALTTSINNAVAKGIIVLAAAGNENGAVLYPGKLPNVITISAVDYAQVKASYSNYGPEIDYAAPGGDSWLGLFFEVGVLSTYPGQNYAYMSGTSMATPVAAGVVALMLGNGTSPSNIRNALNSTAKDLGSPGWDEIYGSGLVQIVQNNWDFNTWFNQYYFDDVVLTLYTYFPELFTPKPKVDWMLILIIVGIAAVVAIVVISLTVRRR